MDHKYRQWTEGEKLGGSDIFNRLCFVYADNKCSSGTIKVVITCTQLVLIQHFQQIYCKVWPVMKCILSQTGASDKTQNSNILCTSLEINRLF